MATKSEILPVQETTTTKNNICKSNVETSAVLNFKNQQEATALKNLQTVQSRQQLCAELSVKYRIFKISHTSWLNGDSLAVVMCQRKGFVHQACDQLYCKSQARNCFVLLTKGNIIQNPTKCQISMYFLEFKKSDHTVKQKSAISIVKSFITSFTFLDHDEKHFHNRSNL